MKVVLWTPNYAPEFMGIPPLVTDCAGWLRQSGHIVDVVTAVPNYPQRVIAPEYRGVLWNTRHEEGVRVRRSWLRVRPGETFVDKGLYEATFAAMSLPNFFRSLRGVDVVVCVVPSVLAAVAAAAVRRVHPRTRLVVWVQDLVLLAARSLGGEAARAERILESVRRLEAWAFRSADKVVVCSPGFTDYVAAAGVAAGRIVTIPNWVDTEEYKPRAPEAGRVPRFVYAGNIGYTQGLETLIDAAAEIGSEVEVDIVGDGNAVEMVRVRATAVDNVRVLPAVPREQSVRLLSEADGLVLVQRGVSANVNFPSKIGPYLASGRPVVAAIEESTPAARLLEESGGAVVVEPEDSGSLADAIRELARDPARRAEMGRRGREFAEASLSADACLSRFESTLLDVLT